MVPAAAPLTDLRLERGSFEFEGVRRRCRAGGLPLASDLRAANVTSTDAQPATARLPPGTCGGGIGRRYLPAANRFR
jgi:hypothetical protein